MVYPTSVDFRGKLVPALRVRIPPPKQACSGTRPVHRRQGRSRSTGDRRRQPLAADPELADEPKKPLRDEIDDEIPF